MDPLNMKASSSLLKLNELCFDKCINTFDNEKINNQEGACIKSCFH